MLAVRAYKALPWIGQPPELRNAKIEVRWQTWAPDMRHWGAIRIVDWERPL